MKKCIFCDSPITSKNKSKEHVIPKWIYENGNPEFDQNMEGKWTSFPNEPEKIFHQRSQPFSALVMGNVCKNCNSNWMSDLENQFKPLFEGLYEEESPIILTNEQCIIISRWTLKTAIALNYSVHYKKIIPLNQARYLYSNPDVPANLNVDLAFCYDVGIKQLVGGNKLAILSNKYENEKSIINQCYIITLQFDHLLLRIFWTPDPRIQIKDIISSKVYRIYPLEGEEIIIQYVKDGLYKDISQFQFHSPIIIDDKVKENEAFKSRYYSE